jgi:hypothetical protein
MIAVVFLAKWPEAYAISSQEVQTVADLLVTNFCRFGVSSELHISYSRNFHRGSAYSYIIRGMNNRPVGGRSSET